MPTLDRLAAGRADVLAVAHGGAVRADAVVPADRPQPPPERVREHLRGRLGLPGLQLAHPVRERVPGRGAAPARVEHVLGRQEPQHPDRRVGDGRLQAQLAAGARVRPLLRLPRRRDQPVVSRPHAGQPVHRPALPARGRLPPLQGPGRQGDLVHPRLQAVRARRSRGSRSSAPAPTTPRTTRRRSGSTSTRAPSTTATRPTASGCCRGWSSAGSCPRARRSRSSTRCPRTRSARATRCCRGTR